MENGCRIGKPVRSDQQTLAFLSVPFPLLVHFMISVINMYHTYRGLISSVGGVMGISL